MLIFTGIFQVNTTYAEEDSGDFIANLGQVDGDFRLKLWKISDKREDYLDPEEQLKTVFDLNKKSEAELDQAYREKILSDLSFVEDGVSKVKIKDLPRGVYYVRGSGIDLEDGTFSKNFLILMPNASGEYDYTAYPKGSSTTEIIKIDSDDERKVLEGAKFRLYTKEGVEVPIENGVYAPNAKPSILTTDSEGRILIKNLPDGDYYLEEIKAPADYEISSKKTSFNVPRDKRIFIKNKKVRGGYSFLKVDQTNKAPLEGAQFVLQVKNPDGTYSNVKRPGTNDDYIISSNKDGVFEVSGLAYGTYYLLELKAPDGYIKENQRIEFTINGVDELGVRKVIENKPNRPPDKPNEPEEPNNPPPENPEEPNEPNNPPPEKPNEPNTPNTPNKPNEPNKPNKPNRPIIPKTGDITIIIMSIGGLIFILMGIWMVKDKSKEN